MITVQLAGGLGNQMFQYAAGRYLSLKHKTDLKLDLSFLLDRTPRKNAVFRDYDLEIFKIDPVITSSSEIINLGIHRRKIKRIIYNFKHILNRDLPEYVYENPFGFDPYFFFIPTHAYLEGYWQSEDYFKEIESIIRNDFVFKNDLTNEGNDLARTISNVNSVCINVRRTTFVTLKSELNFHGVCERDYFERAVQLIDGKLQKPNYFIFSDDIGWCKENLNFIQQRTFVEHSYAGQKYSQYMQLMSLCQHFIIPNSSFGWWGAWLNPDPNKIVIAPKQWYKNTKMDTSHLIPKEWIRI